MATLEELEREKKRREALRLQRGERNMLTGAIETAKKIPELVTGTQRTKQAEQEFGGPLPPESSKGRFLPENAGFIEDLKTVGGRLFFTDEEFTNLVLNIDPDSKAEKFGDATIITLGDGNQFTVNQPGLTGRDILFMAGIGGVAGKVAGTIARFGKTIVSPLRNIFNQSLFQGGGQAGLETARQGAAIATDARESLDPGMIGLAGGLGAAGPPVAGVAGRVRNKTRGPLFRAGEPTKRGRKILSRAGVDDIPIESKQRMNQLAARGATDDQLSGVAKRQVVNVDETAASVTGDEGLAFLEREALRGKLRDPANLSGEAVQNRMLKQLSVTRDRFGSGNMRDVQENLLRRRQIAKRKVDRRFDIARERGGMIKAEGLKSMRREFLRISDEFAVGDTREFKNVLKMINSELRRTPVKKSGAVELKRVTDVRQRINKLISKNADRAEDAALIDMKRVLDDALESSLDSALFQGDEIALKAWRNALNSRTRFRKTFQSKDAVNELTSTLPDGSGRLKVTPDEAANYLFGRSRLGLKRGLENNIKKLKQILPESEWNNVKAAAFKRFFRSGDLDRFPTSFKTELERGLEESPEVFKTLFTKEDTNLMRLLAFHGRRASEGIPVPDRFIDRLSKSFLNNVLEFLEALPVFEKGRKFFRSPLAGRSLRPATSTILSRATRPSPAVPIGVGQGLRSQFGERGQ